MESTHTGSRRPRGANSIVNTVKGFKHEKEPGYHYRVVERQWNKNEPIDKELEAVEGNYELVESGARTALYRIKLKEYEAIEKAYRDEGNARLKKSQKAGLSESYIGPGGQVVEFEETKNETTISKVSGEAIASEMQ